MPHRSSNSEAAGMPDIRVGAPVVGTTVGVAESNFSIAVGENVGNAVCSTLVGCLVSRVGCLVSCRVGCLVSRRVGCLVGRCVGDAVVGGAVGMSELNCAWLVGAKVGDAVGAPAGAALHRQRNRDEQKPRFVPLTLNFRSRMPLLKK